MMKPLGFYLLEPPVYIYVSKLHIKAELNIGQQQSGFDLSLLTPSLAMQNVLWE